MGSKVKFLPIDIPKKRRIAQRYKIWAVKDGSKSQILDHFDKLSVDEKETIKSTITKLATKDQFTSRYIKRSLKGVGNKYSEVILLPHRFFYFQCIGEHIIFFSSLIKKVDSLPDSTYRHLRKLNEYYEAEFRRKILKDS